MERLEWSVVGIRWVEVGQREVTHFKWAGEWVGKAGKKSLRKVNQELHLKTNENPEKAHQKSTRRSKSIEAHPKPTPAKP